MYYCIYRNEFSGDFFMEGSHEDLQEAAKLRKVSGDLIVDGLCKVVDDPSWLFQWEREKPDEYATKMMGKTIKIGRHSPSVRNIELVWDGRSVESAVRRLLRHRSLLTGRMEGGL